MSLILEQSIREVLVADSTVNGLVAGRVRPLIGGQDDIQPRIAYQVTADEDASPEFDGPSGWYIGTVEIDCIGDTAKSCISLSNEVKRIFHLKSVSGSTCLICPSKLTDASDVVQAMVEGSEQPVYLRTLTFEMLYRPS